MSSSLPLCAKTGICAHNLILLSQYDWNNVKETLNPSTNKTSFVSPILVPRKVWYIYQWLSGSSSNRPGTWWTAWCLEGWWESLCHRLLGSNTDTAAVRYGYRQARFLCSRWLEAHCRKLRSARQKNLEADGLFNPFTAIGDYSRQRK